MSDIKVQQHIFSVGADVFGTDSMTSERERADRFAEEAVELLQASGMPLARLIEIANWKYTEPKGNLKQEFGGCGVTLYAMAEANWIDLDTAIRTEINRVEANKEKIRVKATKKPARMFSVIPLAPESAA